MNPRLQPLYRQKHLILILLFLLSSGALYFHDQRAQQHFKQPFLEEEVSIDGQSLIVTASHDDLQETITVNFQLDSNEILELIILVEGLNQTDWVAAFDIITITSSNSSLVYHEGLDLRIYTYRDNVNSTFDYQAVDKLYDTEDSIIEIELKRDDVYHRYQPFVLLTFLVGSVTITSFVVGLSVLIRKWEREQQLNNQTDDSLLPKKILFFVVMTIILYMTYHTLEVGVLIHVTYFRIGFASFLFQLILRLVIPFLLGLTVSLGLTRVRETIDFGTAQSIIRIYLLSALLAIVMSTLSTIILIIVIPVVLYILGMVKVSRDIRSFEEFGILLHLLISQFLFYYSINYSPSIQALDGWYLLIKGMSGIYLLISAGVMYLRIRNSDDSTLFIGGILVLSVIHLAIYSAISLLLRLTVLPVILG